MDSELVVQEKRHMPNYTELRALFSAGENEVAQRVAQEVFEVNKKHGFYRTDVRGTSQIKELDFHSTQSFKVFDEAFSGLDFLILQGKYSEGRDNYVTYSVVAKIDEGVGHYGLIKKLIDEYVPNNGIDSYSARANIDGKDVTLELSTKGLAVRAPFSLSFENLDNYLTHVSSVTRTEKFYSGVRDTLKNQYDSEEKFKQLEEKRSTELSEEFGVDLSEGVVTHHESNLEVSIPVGSGKADLRVYKRSNYVTVKYTGPNIVTGDFRG